MSETTIEITEQMRSHLGIYFAAARTTTDPMLVMLNARNAFDIVCACCDIEKRTDYDDRLNICSQTFEKIFILDLNELGNRVKILWFCSEILKLITPLVYHYATFGTDMITTDKLSGKG